MMNKLATTFGLLTLIAAPLAAAADLPSVTSLGVAVKDQTSIAKPANFAQKVSSASKLDQSRHGCRWAVLPEIYAFSDAIVYTKPGMNSFNVFTLDTANAQGCSLPNALQKDLDANVTAISYENQIDMNATYSLVSISDVKSVKNGEKVESYYKVGDRAKAAPASLLSDMKMGLQITQAQHACQWASRPFIFLFSDAVAYVNNKGTDVNIFSIDEAKAQGCKIPNVQKGDRRNISYVRAQMSPDAAAESGVDDVNQKMEADAGSSSMSFSTPTALKDNLKAGFCAGKWTYFDKWTDYSVDFGKITIEVTDAILTGTYKQSVDRSAVRTIRFPVSFDKYYDAGDGRNRTAAASFAHLNASAICNVDAALQTITTKGLSVFQETLPVTSELLTDSNNTSVRAFQGVTLIRGDEVCSNHVRQAGKRVCNRVRVYDTCEIKYFDVVREQVVITKTYTKNIESQPNVIRALRTTVPGITSMAIKNPANTIPDDSGNTLKGEPVDMKCNTFDDLPLDTREQIQDRYNKLEYSIHQAELGAVLTPGCEQINSPDCPLTTDPDFIGWMKNFWGLNQEYNSMLTPEQRAAIRDRHILFPKYIFPGDEEIIIVDVDVE